jgi:succinate dehydrogenase hydrophobic anchor subunit
MYISGSDIIRFIVAIGFLAYGYDQFFLFHNTGIALVCVVAVLFIFPLTHRFLIEKPLNLHFSSNAKFFVILIFLLMIGMLQKKY